MLFRSAGSGNAAEEAASETAPTEIPVSIDLGEILPLDPFAVEAQAEPDAAAKRDAVGEAGAAFASESFAGVGASFESGIAGEAGAGSESESVSEPEPETVPESKPEFGSEQAVEPGVNFAGHSEPAEELAAAPERAGRSGVESRPEGLRRLPAPRTPAGEDLRRLRI